MWVMSKIGFFSATVASPPSTGGHKEKIKVRARCRRHLDALKRVVPEITDAKVIRGGGTDYRWRIIVSRFQWEACVRKLAAGIDYGNFKGEVDRSGDAAYGKALHRVWDVMMDLQKIEK